MRPLLVAIKGPASKIFSKSSTSSWSPLKSKESQSTNSSGTGQKSGDYPVLESNRTAISAKMPSGEGSHFATRVYGGSGSPWPLMDEEQGGEGIRARSELEQGTTGR